MAIIFCVLSIVIVFIGNSLCRQKKSAHEIENKLRDIIDDQKNIILTLSHEKEAVQAITESQSKEIRRLVSLLEETKHKLDFYKNIEEDSGNLNTSADTKSREELLQKAVMQITADKDQMAAIALSHDDSKSVLDDEQASICKEIENSNRNYFITGKAGTGKSFLLDIFIKTTKKKHIVLAPTGMAALNVGGATLHSTFGYDNLEKFDIDSLSENKISLKSEKN